MNTLERLRYDRGLDRSTLALAAGVSVSTIQGIERYGTVPRAPVAKALAEALGGDLTAVEFIDALRADAREDLVA